MPHLKNPTPLVDTRIAVPDDPSGFGPDVTCPTCDGRGYWTDKDATGSVADPMAGPPQCNTCGGLGRLPKGAAAEVA